MDLVLQEILSDLRTDVPSASGNAGLDNMRAVPLRRGCDPQDLIDFLNAAADTWLARAKLVGIAPATFYAWYDEQAGQLRMSVVPGTTAALPFSGNVDVLQSPHAIVSAALSTWTPGIEPWSELTDADWQGSEQRLHTVAVWART
jgi:hypothetical protein